jgi:hypothetical protein
MGEQCDRFQALLGASLSYPGERFAESDEKGGGEKEKEVLAVLRHVMPTTCAMS